MTDKKPLKLSQLAEKMGLFPATARHWIKSMVPGIYQDGKRKNFFTPAEVDKILIEFAG